jgi:hypothetical protein
MIRVPELKTREDEEAQAFKNGGTHFVLGGLLERREEGIMDGFPRGTLRVDAGVATKVAPETTTGSIPAPIGVRT